MRKQHGTIQVSVHLRNQMCDCIVEIAPAEPDVGLMSPYMVECSVRDEQGHNIPDLTDSEMTRIEEDALEAMRNY